MGDPYAMVAGIRFWMLLIDDSCFFFSRGSGKGEEGDAYQLIVSSKSLDRTGFWSCTVALP